ncbi:MAG TPA: hypothetical protein VHZ28_16170 [Terracidiphilus sp.]|nr:hypothetical protein [Terracidiphilus sp.]
MPVPAGMRRLLRIRELQEEQSRSMLESALQELEQLRATLAAVLRRATQARSLIHQSAYTGEPLDRVAGLEEQGMAARCSDHVAHRIDAAEQHTLELRAHYLSTRVERRQAETLIANAREIDARDGAKEDQNAADERFLCLKSHPAKR